MTTQNPTMEASPVPLYFHSIAPLPQGEHPQTGECRINLTLRQAR